MANTCVCGSNSTGTSQLFSGTRIVAITTDENGRIILIGSDGSTVTSTTSDCCCCTLASKNYALSTIQENAAAFGAITLTTSNGTFAAGTLQTTPITSTNTTVDVTIAGVTSTIPVRDIESITFTTAPTGDLLNSLNCDSSIAAPQCPTNIALEAKLREIIAASASPTVYPVTILGTLSLITNILAAAPIVTIYGICNGILWAGVTVAAATVLQAIPLCTIQNISYTAPVVVP